MKMKIYNIFGMNYETGLFQPTVQFNTATATLISSATDFPLTKYS